MPLTLRSSCDTLIPSFTPPSFLCSCASMHALSWPCSSASTTHFPPLLTASFLAFRLNSRDHLRLSLKADAEPQVEKGTMIAFHGTSTLGHIGDSDVISTSTSAPNTNAIGDPRFATQSTISGISRTKASTLRFTESEWRDVVALDGAKAEHERRTSCEA